MADRQVVYQPSEIARIEQNDRTGRLDTQALRARAEARNAELFQLTGLTAQQRTEVKQVMAGLQSRDSAVRTQARRTLVAMGDDIDVARYLRYYLPSLSPRFVAGVLEVLSDLDPAGTMALLHEHCTDVHPRSRATALQLMGALHDRTALGVLAQGLVDPHPEVRIAAAYALGQLQARQATPVLIDTLASPDLRVRNAGRTALTQIWSTETARVDFPSAQEWAEYWRARVAGVSQPIDPAALEPLVAPDAKYEDE